MSIYPFGVPLAFLAILARHSDELYLDQDMEARKASLEEHLRDLMCGQLESSTRPDEDDGKFLAGGAQHDEEKAQQQRLALEAELHEIEQAVARHQRTVQTYGFIFFQYQSHAWYWEAGMLTVQHS